MHTLVLPVPLEGPVYFVSYGSEKFPDLEIVMLLSGDNVTIELDGNTFISKAGVTSTTFAHVPDAPVSSIELTLPQGRYSALAAYGNLCTSKLTMPTELTAQNGAVIHQNTKIAVSGCPNSISVSSHSFNGRNLTVSVSVPAAGKLAASGKGLSKASTTSKGRETVTLKLHATKGGKFATSVKVTFTPSKGKKQTKSIAISFKK